MVEKRNIVVTELSRPSEAGKWLERLGRADDEAAALRAANHHEILPQGWMAMTATKRPLLGAIAYEQARGPGLLMLFARPRPALRELESAVLTVVAPLLPAVGSREWLDVQLLQSDVWALPALTTMGFTQRSAATIPARRTALLSVRRDMIAERIGVIS